MEAFSLLKFWRSSASTAGGVAVSGVGTNGVAVSGVGTNGVSPIDTKMRSDDANLRTTTTTTIREMSVETDEEEKNGGDGDDGPFFDLEFTIPTDECGEEENVEEEEEEESDSCEDEDDGDGELEGENESTGTEEEEREFDFTVSSGSTGPNLSPSDDLFFKGEFVPIDHSAETQSKLQFPGAFLKPATKLRVFMLGFKKAKSEKPDNNGDVGATLTTTSPAAKPQPQPQPQPQQQPQQSKSFTVKFKVEEVPIMSLFTRDNSSKTKKQHSSEEVAAEEKRFAKAVVNKYLKMVKPLYVRVSKRYGEKLGFSGQLSLGSGAKSGEERPPSQPSNNIKAKTMDSTPPTVKKIESGDEMKELSQSKEKEIPPHVSVKGNLTAGFRVVCKHLGKSRSASSAVAAAPAPAQPMVGVQSKRQDDSLLQQQDGIQSAILHCKRSFNGSRDSDSLSRLSSNQSHEKSKPHDSSRTSFDERKVES